MATLVAGAARSLRTQRVALPRQLGRIVAAIFLLDVLTLLVAVALAWEFRAVLTPLLGERSPAIASGLVPLVVGAWLACLAVRGAYHRHHIGDGFDEFRAVALGSGSAVAIIGMMAFFVASEASRGFLLLAFLLGTPLLMTERYGLRKMVHAARKRGHLRSRVIVVATPLALSELVTTLERAQQIGYSIVGTCLPEREAHSDPTLPVPLYGGIDQILHACRLATADTVIVAAGGIASSAALRRVGWALEGQDIDLIVIPSLIDVAGPRIRMRHVSGLPLVHVEEPHAGAAGGAAKRLFDLLVASLMLIVLAPVMLVIAAAVKLQDRGPVFFRQERSGIHGARFTMTKFRSMIPDADRRLEELIDFSDADDVLFKMKHDPRVTRAGRTLRRYSLDELPQLFDVLRGDMSLVGPRPPLPREVEQYPEDMHRRLLVRPGLTGLWQVSGRSDLSFDEAIRMDLYYVDNWSITGDIIIMLKTIRAVFGSKGAY